ncbi:uncharacterized protein [Littorina saxatilis]
MTEKQPFMETTRSVDERSALAAAGSAETSDVHLPVTSTLNDQRRGFQKVVPDDPEPGIAWFYASGKTAFMEDRKASLNMLEKAIPVINSGTGRFGFLYAKDLKADESCFKKNLNLVFRRSLGSGVAGEVTAFSDMQMKKKFVRKRLKAGSLRMEEVQSMLKMEHSGVCQVYALLCHDSTVDLILQDAGFPLRDCLQKFCKESISGDHYWQVVQDLGRQGFEALRYVHHEGICHLDIKPENILLHQNRQKDLVLVLADFGSSLSLKDMVTFKLQMTPEYWAPEMWQHVGQFLLALQSGQGGKPEADEFPPAAALDTFAMALVLFFMATLQHFVLAEQEKKDSSQTVVNVEEVEHLRQQFGGKLDAKFAFNFLLMTKYVHHLPDLATNGRWLFDGVPSAILEVMKSALDPDPNKRWTDEQAACYLSAGIVREQVSQEDPLKIPTPVDDPTDHSDGDSQVIPDLPLPAQAMHAASALEPVSPAPKLFDGAARFQEQIAPLLKPWDNVVPGILTANQNGKPATNVPSRPASQFAMPDDIALRSSSPESAVPLTYSQAGASQIAQTHRPRLGGLKPADWQGPDMEEEMPGEGNVDVDMKENVKAEQLVPDPSAPGQPCYWVEKEKNSEGLADGGTDGGLGGHGNWAGQGLDMQVSSPQSKVAHQMGALSIQPKTQSPPASVTSLGKGGGKRKAARPGGKLGKERKISQKGVSQSAPMKVGSPEKKGAFPQKQKRLPSESLKADKCVAKIPFVVVSSGRRNPSPRTMHGSSVGKADHHMSDTALSGKAGSGPVQTQPVTGLGDSSTAAFIHQGFGISATGSPPATIAVETSLSQQQSIGEPGMMAQQFWFSDGSRPLVMGPFAVDTVLQNCGMAHPASPQPQEKGQFSLNVEAMASVQLGQGETTTVPVLGQAGSDSSQLQLSQTDDGTVGSIPMDEVDEAAVNELMQLLQEGLPDPESSQPLSTGQGGQQSIELGGQAFGVAGASHLNETPPGQVDEQGVAERGQGMSEAEEVPKLVGFNLGQQGQLQDPALVQRMVEEGGAPWLIGVDLDQVDQQNPGQGGVAVGLPLDEIAGTGQWMDGGPGQGGLAIGLGPDEIGGAQLMLTEESHEEGGNMPNFDMIFD